MAMHSMVIVMVSEMVSSNYQIEFESEPNNRIKIRFNSQSQQSTVNSQQSQQSVTWLCQL